MSGPTRCFYAHPKAQEEQIVGDVAAILAHLRAKLNSQATVTSGREEYDRSFSSCGRSWDAWATRWGSGVLSDGSPVFHIVVVPDDGEARCGAATSTGVYAALTVHRPVYLWRRDGNVWRRVISIEKVSPSWQTGWELQCS